MGRDVKARRVPGCRTAAPSANPRLAGLGGIVFAGALALVSACTNATTSVTGPSGGKCDVAVTASLAAAPPEGGNGTLSVSTARDCRWNAASDAEWITIVGGATGQGDGSSAYRVAENIQPVRRQAELHVNEQRVTVSQAAACRYIVAPTTVGASAEGVTAQLRVETAADCAWTASSDAPWARVESGGRGPRTIPLQIAANGGGPRSARVTVAGQVVTVTQSGPRSECTFTVTPTAASIAAAGAVVETQVATAPACAWTVVSDVSWITVTRPPAGPGPSNVGLAVAPNTGPSRSGTVTVAGVTVTVTQEPAPQAAVCQIELSAPAAPFSPAGGSASIAVTANLSTCSWSATSSAAWLRLTSADTGRGNGTITFTVDANTGGERAGTVTVADKLYRVTQRAAPPPACQIDLSAPGPPMPAGGGAGAVVVTANVPTCSWSATSSARWLRLTGAGTGRGSGAVAFTVDANPGGERTGTLTVGDKLYSVTQAAAPPPACQIDLSPPGPPIPAAGGSGSIGVTANLPTCLWSATASAPWLRFTSAATGSGSGTIAFAVDANTAGERTATVTVGDKLFPVTQAAAPPPACHIELSPSGPPIPAGGGSGSIGVTANLPTCLWSATAGASWLRLTSSTTGSGSGTIAFAVDANPGEERTGTVNVAGKLYLVTQAAAPPPACQIEVSAPGAPISAAGGSGSVAVTANLSTCLWSATSSASWLVITSAASGSGSGTVTFTAEPNAGPDRSATITVAGRSVTVSQSAASQTAGAYSLGGAGSRCLARTDAPHNEHQPRHIDGSVNRRQHEIAGPGLRSANTAEGECVYG